MNIWRKVFNADLSGGNPNDTVALERLSRLAESNGYDVIHLQGILYRFRVDRIRGLVYERLPLCVDSEDIWSTIFDPKKQNEKLEEVAVNAATCGYPMMVFGDELYFVALIGDYTKAPFTVAELIENREIIRRPPLQTDSTG